MSKRALAGCVAAVPHQELREALDNLVHAVVALAEEGEKPMAYWQNLAGYYRRQLLEVRGMVTAIIKAPVPPPLDNGTLRGRLSAIVEIINDGLDPEP